MAVNVNEKIKKLSPARRKKIEARAAINGGAIIDHEAPDKRRFVEVQK
jgi:hypothetical protein